MGRGRKSYLGPAESIFSSWDLSRHNKHDIFYFGLFYWLDISTFYFYEPLLAFPLSIIAFTANIQADSHFCKYIYLFQILYSMKYHPLFF